MNIILKRADLGYNYGVILIPEGLIDFIPEVVFLIFNVLTSSSSSLHLSLYVYLEIKCSTVSHIHARSNNCVD